SGVLRPSAPTLLPYTTLFRSDVGGPDDRPPFLDLGLVEGGEHRGRLLLARRDLLRHGGETRPHGRVGQSINNRGIDLAENVLGQDRKSTRLNSSHQIISYAVF